MAALGSEVQSTSTELVSVIEEMKDRRAQLDADIRRDEEEKQRIVKELQMLEARLHAVDERLMAKTAARNDLDKAITDTSAAFRGIVKASRKLLNSAKEESNHLQMRDGALAH